MVLWIADNHKPVKNPPRWPITSTLIDPITLKMKIKKEIIVTWKNSWHFRVGPKISNPLKFIIKYPTIIPIIPYKDVDAPAFTLLKSASAEKILPPIPETIYTIAVCHGPYVY